MIYYIDETNEFIKDKETAEGAMNAGLSVHELDEDMLVNWLKQAWEDKSEILMCITHDMKEIQRMCEDGINSGINTNAVRFSMIHHTTRELRNKLRDKFNV